MSCPLMFATALSFLKAAFQPLAGTGPLVHTLNVACVFDDDMIIVHDDVRLAARIKSILVVVVIVVTNQTRVRINGMRAEVYRGARHVEPMIM
jgi:hypothetical protein